MSAFTTSFTGVRVVSKTTVAKKTVSTKACASMDFKKVRREFARAPNSRPRSPFAGDARIDPASRTRRSSARRRASARARPRSRIFEFRLARATDARATNAIARATDDASIAD
jgi:hypothetical protein|tara:strand:+ start:3134 stop:3472 length:339 start_codon:yes stop_codon:yes gene_type:complete